jgi:hypothetical protein
MNHICSIVKSDTHNTISRHSRLSGIERLKMLNTKKDSGQAGMTELNKFLAGLTTSK